MTRQVIPRRLRPRHKARSPVSYSSHPAMESDTFGAINAGLARAYAAVLLRLTFGGIVIQDRYKRLFTCQKTRWERGGAATAAHIFLNSLAISPARQPRNCTLLPGRIWLACNLHRSVPSIR